MDEATEKVVTISQLMPLHLRRAFFQRIYNRWLVSLGKKK